VQLPPDFQDLLQEFDDAEVKYLVVGGYAVSFHARPRFTKDLDIWLEDSAVNLSRAKTALRRFGAPEPTLDALEAARGLDVVWMGRPPLRVDLMKQIPGAEFGPAFERRVISDWNGVEVAVLSRQDLIESKAASGRDQDLVDEKLLRQLDGTEE
jgi:hypothetical protein